MLDTTRDWKVALGCYQIPNREALVPANDIKIEYEQIDASAQNSASVSVNSSVSWSDHSEVMNLSLDYSTQHPVATLEHNEWVLDGSMIFNNQTNHNGWVSEYVSNADGGFETTYKHSITCTFRFEPTTGDICTFNIEIESDDDTVMDISAMREWLFAHGYTDKPTSHPATGRADGYDVIGIYSPTRLSSRILLSDNHSVATVEVVSFVDTVSTIGHNPKLTLTWSSVQTITIPCLSIWWSSLLDEWATEFTITAKNGDFIVYQETVTNGEVSGAYGSAFSGYNKVEIEIIRWCLPYRHARIENICMGFTVYISKSEIMSAEHGMSSDLLTFTLPDDYFTFEMDNVSEEWNPDNPTGRYAYLLERQRVTVKYAFKINGGYEWHTAGTYFMSEWTTPQNGITASFTARSLVDFMTKQFNPSAISGYSFGNSISLKNLALNAFQQAGLPIDADGSVKYSVCNELANINVVIPYTTDSGVNKWDFDYSCAEVIQLCANAGQAVIRPNADGDICIVMPDTEVGDYYIDRFVSYSNGEYETAKALKTININDGALIYTPSESVDTGEEQSIQNCLIQNSSQRTDCATWMSSLLLKRKAVSGEFRADPRLQPLDVATVVNKYAMNIVYISEVKWNYGGAFSGSYVGKVLKSIPLVDQQGDYYANAVYAGEYGGN